LQKDVPGKGCFPTLERYFGIPIAPSKAIGMERRNRRHFQGFSIVHFMGPILKIKAVARSDPKENWVLKKAPNCVTD
jgi:hypothetical protein